jgi:hypothetical protein
VWWQEKRGERLYFEGRLFGSGKFLKDQERETKETIYISKERRVKKESNKTCSW